MHEIPVFNYRTVYFFWLSLFGSIFVLALMDLIKVEHPEAFLLVSFFNIVASVVTWIYLMSLDDTFEEYRIEHRNRPSELKEDFKWYNRRKVMVLIVTTFFVYVTTLIAIGLQFI